MIYTTRASILHEGPKVCDFQKSDKKENYENLEIEDGKRAAVGLVVGAIISIPIWIMIISFIIWVIPYLSYTM